MSYGIVQKSRSKWTGWRRSRLCDPGDLGAAAVETARVVTRQKSEDMLCEEMVLAARACSDP